MTKNFLRNTEPTPEFLAEMRQRMEARNRRIAERPEIEAKGLEALKRLLAIAKGDSGQCRYVARFLLGLYNGTRFPFDLTNLRGLDYEIFDDCLAVLRMDHVPRQEVHTYFENGGQIWEGLARDWNVKDYSGS